MRNKKISIIMSVYNTQNYLSRAIESILNQIYKNIEFIIINDGSTDSSINIIQKYAKNDNRILVVDQKNMGLTKALNIATCKATGDYIARMDADDISLLNRFENFMDYINRKGDIDIYSTPAIVIDENDNTKKIIPNYFRRNGFDQKLLNYYNSMIHGTLIVKTEILKKYKYNEEYKYSQDFELYHRLMKNGYKISYDKNNITYQLRVHSDSISNTQKPEQLRLYEKIFEDNSLRFYQLSFIHKIYFRLIDIYFFFKKKLYSHYQSNNVIR
jgi:glycosyltransferase involved in cell wall biosynthesis